MSRTEKLSYDDFMQIMKEIAKRFEETDRQFKENQQEIIRMSKETDRQFKENQQEMMRMSKETDRQFKKNQQEMMRMSKETDKKLNKLQGLFTTQWGKLVEAVVAPACLNLFIQRGIDVSNTYKNSVVKINGVKKAEYDVVLANGDEVVIVEVKTTLKVEHVDYFLKKLQDVKTWIKSYSDKNIYGAIAAISFDESSDSYAIRNGLFVIKNSGNGIVQIDNDINFTPKTF